MAFIGFSFLAYPTCGRKGSLFLFCSQFVDFLLAHMYQVTEDVQNLKSKLNNLESKLEEVS
jgi:hypothetical protein